MGKIKYLFFALFSFVLIILGTQKVWAADSDVVINEVMANPAVHPDPITFENRCSNDICEWIELFNNGIDPIDLESWYIDGDPIIGSNVIQPKDFFIITKNKTSFLKIWNVDPNKVLQLSSLSLKNTSAGSPIDTVTIEGRSYKEEFSWVEPAEDDISWERIDPTKTGDDNWHPSVTGGTPGKTNSEYIPPYDPDYPPEVLDLVNLEDALIYQVRVSSIVDGDTIKVTGLEDSLPSTIRLLYIDTPEEGQPFYDSAKDFTSELLGQTVDLLISQNPDEQIDNPIYDRTLAVVIYNDQVFNTELLDQGLASYYDTDNSVLKSEAWLAILQQAQKVRIGLWASTGNIFLSELLPDPVGNDAEGEWVEIYNPTEDQVVLSRFLLDQYFIPSGTKINPKSYYVFHRNQTGVILNNGGDTVKLSFPGGLLIDETSYESASEGLSWVKINGIWNWTTTVTPGEPNVLGSVLEDASDDEGNSDIPKNSTAIEIKTGDIKNYENYLVKITGVVVETSGNTFYLDDGSGRVKVYIQAATGIDKPEMHKGDIFEVEGIVNLYRGVWRILPQKQEDIKIVQAKKEEEVDSESKVKTVSVKSSTASKSTSSNTTAKARAPTTTKVASNNKNILGNSTQVEGYHSPFWVEIIKALTGLALVFLIILIVKLWKLKKDNPSADGPLGGNFGNDYT